MVLIIKIRIKSLDFGFFFYFHIVLFIYIHDQFPNLNSKFKKFQQVSPFKSILF